MKPGRELDKIIAEKVMNLEVSYDGKVFVGEGAFRYPAWPVQHYSTDISSAWKVVEKLQNKSNIPYQSDEFTLQRTDDGWRAGYMCFIDCVEQSDGNTPEHAICLAALKAVGYEAPDGS